MIQAFERFQQYARLASSNAVPVEVRRTPCAKPELTRGESAGTLIVAALGIVGMGFAAVAEDQPNLLPRSGLINESITPLNPERDWLPDQMDAVVKLSDQP